MNERPRTLGTHLLVELNECDATLLDDIALVKQALLDAADEAGATIVGEVFHKFSPVGVTGIVCIAESHISIHTWPEHAYAAVDIFTCGAMDTALILQRLRDTLNPCREHLTTIRRGLAEERVDV